MTIITRIGKGSSLTWTEEDGNFTDLDNRTKEAWNTISGDMSTAGVADPPTKTPYKGTVLLDLYDPNNICECSVVFHMPHDFVVGSSWYPHGHFHSPTASSGVVRWGFQLMWANQYRLADFGRSPLSSEIFTNPATGYVEVTMDASHQDANNTAESTTPFTVAGLGPGAVILMRVFRDATHVNDTYPDGMFLTNVSIAYRSQNFGTSTI